MKHDMAFTENQPKDLFFTTYCPARLETSMVLMDMAPNFTEAVCFGSITV